MIILQYHEVFFRFAGMAGGAACLKKKPHDIVMLSFFGVEDHP